MIFFFGVLNTAKGRRLKLENIVALAHQIDVLTTNSKILAQACKEAGRAAQAIANGAGPIAGMASIDCWHDAQ